MSFFKCKVVIEDKFPVGKRGLQNKIQPCAQIPALNDIVPWSGLYRRSTFYFCFCKKYNFGVIYKLHYSPPTSNCFVCSYVVVLAYFIKKVFTGGTVHAVPQKLPDIEWPYTPTHHEAVSLFIKLNPYKGVIFSMTLVAV